MEQPKGTLTPSQYEILEAAWSRLPEGATVAEIWQAISSSRAIARTTVLNLVDRLERRGWLVRHEGSGARRYKAAFRREKTGALLAKGFVDDFFGGSATNLVTSLLGSKRLTGDEIMKLRGLLAAAASKDTDRGGKEK